MKTLIRHIEYLLSRKDCVIIPGIGAILAQRLSAVFDKDNNTIEPPHRLLTFNSGLNHDDGLLVSSIQRAEGLRYEAALLQVNNAVDLMMQELRNTGSLRLGAVGTLNYVADSLTFVPGDIDTISVDTIWLPEVKLRPLVDEKPTIIEAPIVKSQSFTFKSFIKAAASLALLISIGFIASTPIKVDDSTLASLAPEMHKITTSEIVPETEATSIIDIKLPAPSEESVIENPSRPAIPEINKPKYYVVVASFATNSEAKEFLATHPDDDLSIMPGRYYRVYSSSHQNWTKARNAAIEASETYTGAWVFKH